MAVLAALYGCRDQVPPMVSGVRPVSDTTTRVAAISIRASHMILAVGDSLVLTAMARDTFENALPGRVVRWSSDYPSIVDVSAGGVVVAGKPGTTSIVATAGRHEQRITITVKGTDSVVRVPPGTDIAALARRSPAGTTFLLLAGVHRRQSITPRDGMTFVGETGAVLDGELATKFAFRGDSGSNVTLRHLAIRRYVPPVQDGAIHAEGADGWVVDSCDVGENATGGIRLGNRMRIMRSTIHDNGQIGILGTGDDVLVEGSEIARNNMQAKYDMYWEAGGTKFTHTHDLMVRRNFVHDNHGPGLWTDIDNVRTWYVGNRVERNAEAGILHEISYSAMIRENTVSGNGASAKPADGVTGAGILVSVSSNVEVVGNRVSDNHNGIVGIQDSRGQGVFGTHVLQDLDVHDNSIDTKVGVTGVVSRGLRGLLDRATFDARGNVFRLNSYARSFARKPFAWRHMRRTADEWRALGMDADGTFGR